MIYESHGLNILRRSTQLSSTHKQTLEWPGHFPAIFTIDSDAVSCDTCGCGTEEGNPRSVIPL